MMSAANRLLAFEAVGIAAANGLDPAIVVDRINKSSGRNSATMATFPNNIFPDNNFEARFTMALMEQDVALAAELAGDSFAHLTLTPLILRNSRMGIERFGRNGDITTCCGFTKKLPELRSRRNRNRQNRFPGRTTTMTQTSNRTYEVIRDFLKLPNGEKFGLVSRVATDSQDRVYVFQRRDPPVVVFERDGTYLGAWGSGEVTDPHGLKIVDDVVYTTDRSGSVAKSFTLDGKPLLELGQRGVHSDTGCTGSPWLAVRAAGPFNHPTEMIAHPNGDIYVTDGYRNARVHRFICDGQLVTSWGTPCKAPGPVPPAALRRVRLRRQALCRRSREPTYPDLHAGRRLSGSVDRHGRAERHHPRPGRHLRHRRAGSWRRPGLRLRP